jgi:hypothetical protein
VGFDVRGVEFFDHLDAGAAVLGNLIYVRAFHQAEADVRVPQAGVSGTWSFRDIMEFQGHEFQGHDTYLLTALDTKIRRTYAETRRRGRCERGIPDYDSRAQTLREALDPSASPRATNRSAEPLPGCGINKYQFLICFA